MKIFTLYKKNKKSTFKLPSAVLQVPTITLPLKTKTKIKMIKNNHENANDNKHDSDNNDHENKDKNENTIPKHTPSPIDNNMYNALCMDFKDDIEETTNTTHNNRFLHHFLDSYNAKMGDFGNYIKSATANIHKTLTDLEVALRVQIEETLEETEREFEKFSTQLQSAEATLLHTVDNTNKTISKLTDQFAYFKDNMEQY
jgi:hypothetical protein